MTDRLTARRLKEIASLQRKKYRDTLGQVLVEGVRSVEAALVARAPLVEVLTTASAREQPRVQAMLAQASALVCDVSERDLAKVSDVQTAQGVLAVAEARWRSLDEVGSLDRLVVLDGVQDPGNVGTIIRTAAWFGADAVVAGPGTADLYHPKVVRAAMGGLWDLALARASDLGPAVAQLQVAGHAVYGADLDGTPARRWHPADRAVLVLGSEAHGISEAVGARLDERVSIQGRRRPRQGVESLNVGIAAGILLSRWLGAG